MDFLIFSITDETTAYLTGFASVISCWFIGWVVGQVINLIRFS